MKFQVLSGATIPVHRRILFPLPQIHEYGKWVSWSNSRYVKAFPTCATPNGTFLREVRTIFAKFTNIPERLWTKIHRCRRILCYPWKFGTWGWISWSHWNQPFRRYGHLISFFAYMPWDLQPEWILLPIRRHFCISDFSIYSSMSLSLGDVVYTLYSP